MMMLKEGCPSLYRCVEAVRGRQVWKHQQNRHQHRRKLRNRLGGAQAAPGGARAPLGRARAHLVADGPHLLPPGCGPFSKLRFGGYFVKFRVRMNPGRPFYQNVSVQSKNELDPNLVLGLDHYHVRGLAHLVKQLGPAPYSSVLLEPCHIFSVFSYKPCKTRILHHPVEIVRVKPYSR